MRQPYGVLWICDLSATYAKGKIPWDWIMGTTRHHDNQLRDFKDSRNNHEIFSIPSNSSITTI